MKHFFETTAGVKIEIAPISLVDLQLVQSAVEKEFRDNGEPLDPPTYKVETLGGDFETHEYTELTIAEDNVPESDKVIWAAHKAAKEKL